MKYLYKWKVLASLFALLFVVTMCMTIENITHPDNAKVNSQIEIGVELKLVPGNDNNTEMVFAVLAPKSWKIAESAVLTYSTTGYTKGDIVNEQMDLMPASEVEPTSALAWSAALQSRIGLMGNLGPVEWVVFKTKTKFIISDEDEKLIKANVKINLKTGSQNIKLFMGYFFSGKDRGFHSEYFTDNAKSKVLTVTGGTNAMLDYTTVSLVSANPGSFGWGDIISINFETEVGDVITELKGADKVYIYGRAKLSDGSEVVIDEISAKTLMVSVGSTTRQKYIYPKQFFNLPKGSVITEAYFHFTNEDKSITVKNSSGEDFQVTATCED